MDIPTEPSLETSSQRQARIRREKREKKILDGGASRLDKITSLSGRPLERTSVETSPPSNPPATSPSRFEDAKPSRQSPKLLDTPSSLEQNEVEETMRRLLRSTESGSQGPSGPVGPAPDQNRGLSNEDPIARLVQQMMGVPPPEASSTSGHSQTDGLPPHLAAMLGESSPSEQQVGVHTPYRYLWKIFHAVSALLLAVYVLTSNDFTGSLASRLRFDASTPPSAGTVFWVFVTVELGLQAARYLLEGASDRSGTTATLAQILPPLWRERLLLASRYSAMVTDFTDDFLIVVWMLGAAAWWNDGLT